MDYVTANDIARQFKLTGLQLRNALRAAKLPWRPRYTKGAYTRWRVPVRSPEHKDMLRIAKQEAKRRAA